MASSNPEIRIQKPLSFNDKNQSLDRYKIVLDLTFAEKEKDRTDDLDDVAILSIN